MNTFCKKIPRIYTGVLKKLSTTHKFNIELEPIVLQCFMVLFLFNYSFHNHQSIFLFEKDSFKFMQLLKE
jgi:hypothetical protein